MLFRRAVRAGMEAVSFGGCSVERLVLSTKFRFADLRGDRAGGGGGRLPESARESQADANTQQSVSLHTTLDDGWSDGWGAIAPRRFLRDNRMWRKV